MKPEPIDEFEQQLRGSLARRPAPPGFKQRLLYRRSQSSAAGHRFLWQRIAASVLLAAVVSGLLTWNHIVEQHRREEEVRRQLFIALRITHHAIRDVQTRLAAHSHNAFTQGDIQ